MTLAFLNIGTQEMILIVIVILLLFGGKKLPELARGLGKGIREFKDASEGIKREISDQINNFRDDLDVTAENKNNAPQDKIEEPSVEKQATEEETVAVEEKKEKKPFPQFTVPENAMQHNPGEQPSSGDQHYSYGYSDHITSADDASETEDTPKPTDTESKNA